MIPRYIKVYYDQYCALFSQSDDIDFVVLARTLSVFLKPVTLLTKKLPINWPIRIKSCICENVTGKVSFKFMENLGTLLLPQYQNYFPKLLINLFQRKRVKGDRIA